MRPGLVSVGVLLAVLAVGMLLVVNLAPTTTQNRDWFTLPPQPFRGNTTAAALIQGTDASRATLTLHWSATAPAHVALYAAPGCPAPTTSCAAGAPLVEWTSALGGNWSTSGSLGFPYLLTWVSSSAGSGSFSANALEESPGGSALPSLSSLLIDGGAVVLAVIGGIATFLGLFLRGGVYAGPAPLVSRSADDAAEIARPPPGRP